jgi:ACR3 family arsenite efflux pump ArsB
MLFPLQILAAYESPLVSVLLPVLFPHFIEGLDLSAQVIGGQDIDIGFWTVAKSVLIFLGAPLVAGIITRYTIIALKGREWLDKKFMPWFGPVALLALIYTVLVLFGMQGERVIDEIGSVFRVAVPMLLYFSYVPRTLHHPCLRCAVSMWLSACTDLQVYCI